MRWTEEQKTYLRENYGSTVSIPALCAMLKRSRGSIIGQAHRQGLCEPNSQGKEERRLDTQSRKPYLWEYTTWQYLRHKR